MRLVVGQTADPQPTRTIDAPVVEALLGLFRQHRRAEGPRRGAPAVDQRAAVLHRDHQPATGARCDAADLLVEPHDLVHTGRRIGAMNRPSLDIDPVQPLFRHAPARRFAEQRAGVEKKLDHGGCRSAARGRCPAIRQTRGQASTKMRALDPWTPSFVDPGT